MRVIKLTLAYDGTAYAGWQVQPDRPTVQGVLQDAIERITGQSACVIGSGRTDAGVHALGQVAGFSTDSTIPPSALLRAINAHVPSDIAVLDAIDTHADFHPIRDATGKRYRYVIHDGPVRDVFGQRYAWHHRARLDVEAMRQAAEHLVGTHDFASFQGSGSPRKSTVRTIRELQVYRGRGGQGGDTPISDKIHFEITANGFLYNMARAIVGTLVEVGRAAHAPRWLAQVLTTADRSSAGPTAPPEGLFLVHVEYGS